MAKQKKDSDSEILTDAIIRGIQEKKGINIVKMDLRNVGSAICDFFIVCHGTSNRQVDSIADSVVEEVMKSTGEKPFIAEGKRNAEWVLLDFVNVIVHIFQDKFRDHYGIEDLWSDAAIQDIAE